MAFLLADALPSADAIPVPVPANPALLCALALVGRRRLDLRARRAALSACRRRSGGWARRRRT